jgi:hypothetical protein
MATSLFETNTKESGDAIQNILLPGCGYTAVKPKATIGQTTILRLLPEVAPDGSILPMVTGMDENGPLISSICKEKIALWAGTMTKFHGLVTPSDRDDLKDADLPFAGLFIQLKGDMNKKRVPDQHYRLVSELLQKEPGRSAPLSSIQDHLLVRAIVIKLDGKDQSPVMTKAVVVFGPAGRKALAEAIFEAHKAGVDLFHPETGHGLIFEPVAVGGGTTSTTFNISSAGVMPLTPEVWDGSSPAWSQLLKYHTYNALIQKMVACYGADVVAMKPGFREAMANIGATASAPQAQAPAPAPAKGWGTPAAPAAQTQAPAAGGWGAAKTAVPATPAAPPVPAPAAGGWGSVKAPTTPPVTAPAPAAAATPEKAAEALMKAYEEKLKKGK